MLETIILAALAQTAPAFDMPPAAQVVAFELAAAELDKKIASPPSHIRLALDDKHVSEEAVQTIQRHYKSSAVSRGDCRSEKPASCALLRVEVESSKCDEFVVHSWAYAGAKGWWSEYRLRRAGSKWTAEKSEKAGGIIGDGRPAG